MIPEKIEQKIKTLSENEKKYKVIMALLKYEDAGRGKQIQNCKAEIERYIEELDDEN